LPKERVKKNRRLSYGYLVLIACFFILVLEYGSLYCFGVFFKPMLNDFGWTRAATSGPFTLNLIIVGILGIISGRLSDRISPRIIVTCGAIILGLGYLLTSGITDLWQFYLYYGFLVALGLSTMYVPLSSLISHWFPHQRGLMTGISISGIGFGIGVLPTIATHITISLGWRNAMQVVGITCLVLIGLLSQVLKNPPDIVSIRESDGEISNEGFGKRPNYSFEDALGSWRFWMICLAWFGYGFLMQVGLVHIVPYATDIGMSATAAATLLITIGLVGTPARMLLGLSGDRFGNRAVLTLSFSLLGMAFFAMTMRDSVWMLYVFAAIFGAFSGVGVLAAPVCAEYFGHKSLGIIVGVVIFAFCLGSGISPTMAGYIFDVTGSYNIAFLSCGFFGIIAGISIWSLRPYHRF